MKFCGSSNHIQKKRRISTRKRELTRTSKPQLNFIQIYFDANKKDLFVIKTWWFEYRMENHCQGQGNSSESPTVHVRTGKAIARLVIWYTPVEMWWHTVTHGGEWRGNRRMEWVASSLHTTSENGVSSITTADAHISAASSRLNWRPRRFKWTRPFRRKTKSDFWVCAITFQLVSAVNGSARYRMCDKFSLTVGGTEKQNPVRSSCVEADLVFAGLNFKPVIKVQL